MIWCRRQRMCVRCHTPCCVQLTPASAGVFLLVERGRSEGVHRFHNSRQVSIGINNTVVRLIGALLERLSRFLNGIRGDLIVRVSAVERCDFSHCVS